MTWRWLSKRAALAIHAEQIVEHGGAPGVRDEGLLDSALARPRQRAAYAEPDTADLAAAYAFVIVRNHPFVDGNKRTGFVAAATFLLLNGCELEASEGDVVTTFGQLAAGAFTEQRLADWFRRNSSCPGHGCSGLFHGCTILRHGWPARVHSSGRTNDPRVRALPR